MRQSSFLACVAPVFLLLGLALILVSAAPGSGARPAPASSGFAAGPATAPAAPAAPNVVLYDQYNNPGTSSTGSQNFDTANDAFDSYLADDFVVPAGQSWTITEVDVQGLYFNGPGPAASFNVSFYSNSGSLPSGVPIASRTSQPFSGNPNFVITLSSAVALNPGTYWVSVQANQDFTPAGQWGWTDRTVTSNSPAAWENPGGGFGICTTWGARAATCAIDTPAPDQVFRLAGTSGPTAVLLLSFTAQRSTSGVTLHWRTAWGTQVAGFNLYRERAGRLVRLNRLLIGSGSAFATMGRAYSWLDSRPAARTTGYRLQAVFASGARSWLGSARG